MTILELVYITTLTIGSLLALTWLILRPEKGSA